MWGHLTVLRLDGIPKNLINTCFRMQKQADDFITSKQGLPLKGHCYNKKLLQCEINDTNTNSQRGKNW